MIIPENSFIRKPPIILDKSQVVTFNAIRYSIDICDISMSRLCENLSNLTETKSINSYDFPNIFLDAWNIINNSYMFLKIITREFKIESNNPILDELNKTKDLRDSNQHFEERINQTLTTDNFPIYGFLSWRKNYLGTNKVINSTIYSGTVSNKDNLKMSISNISREEPNDIIQMIEFTNVIRTKKNKTNVFSEQQISISKLITDINKIIKSIDQQINDDLSKYKDLERHNSDLLIQLKGILI